MKYRYLLVVIVFTFINNIYSQEYNVDVTMQDTILTVSCGINNIDSKEIDYLIFDKTQIIDSLIIDNKLIKTKYYLPSDTFYLDKDVRKSINFIYRINIEEQLKDSLIYFNRTSLWIPYSYDKTFPLTLKVKTPYPFKSLSANLINTQEGNNIIENTFCNIHNTHFPLLIYSKKRLSKTEYRGANKTFNFYFSNKRKELQKEIIKEIAETYTFFTDFYIKNNDISLDFVEVSNIDFVQSLNQFVTISPDYIYYYKFPSMQFWPSHETIHQWIGAGYFVNLKKNNVNRWFIEESLTEYLRYTYLENKFDKDTLDNLIRANIKEYDSKIKGTNNDISITQSGPNRMVYAIGPLYFHYIREQIGLSSWKNLIASLYSEKYGLFISYNDFKKCLSKYLSTDKINKIDLSLKERGIPDYIRKLIEEN